MILLLIFLLLVIAVLTGEKETFTLLPDLQTLRSEGLSDLQTWRSEGLSDPIDCKSYCRETGCNRFGKCYTPECENCDCAKHCL